MGATPAAPPAGAAATAPAPTVPSLRFTDTHCHIHDRATYDFALRRHLSDSKKFRRLDAAAQAADFFGWRRVSCVDGGGALRPPEDIHREILSLIL